MKNTFKRVLAGLIAFIMLAGMIPAGMVAASDFDTSVEVKAYIYVSDADASLYNRNAGQGDYGFHPSDFVTLLREMKAPSEGALTTLGELQGQKIADWFDGLVTRKPVEWRIWRVQYTVDINRVGRYKLVNADPTAYYIDGDDTFTDAMLKAFEKDKKSGTKLEEGGILIAEPFYDFQAVDHYTSYANSPDSARIESSWNGYFENVEYQWYRYGFAEGGKHPTDGFGAHLEGYPVVKDIDGNWEYAYLSNGQNEYGAKYVYDLYDSYDYFPVVVSALDGTVMKAVDSGAARALDEFHYEWGKDDYENRHHYIIKASVPFYFTVEQREKDIPALDSTTVYKIPIEGAVGEKFYPYESGLYGCFATAQDDGSVKEFESDPVLIYAKKPTKNTVKFDANGGSGTMPSITVGRKFTLPQNGFTAPEGKAFRCWEINGVEYKVGTELTSSDNMVVKPVWDDPYYTVIYNFSDGTKETVQFELDVPTELLSDASARVGYKFVGWSKNNYSSKIDFAPGESVTNIAAIGETINLYSMWEYVGSYYVYFRASNGTSEFKTQSITVGVETPLIENPFTYDGYVFDFWSTAMYGSGTRYTDKQAVKDLAAKNGSVNLYANWKKLPSFTVVFNANDGTGTTKTQTIAIDAETALAENTFARDNYRFIGWNTKADGTGTSYTNKESVLNLAAENAKVNLYAVWEQLYTVSFDANGGTGEMASVPNVKGDYVLPENGFTAPESTRFKCWSVNGAEKQVGDTITIADNTTVTAVWEQLYTVSFDANGGTGTMASVPNVKGDYVLPANEFTAPEGMRFKCWSVNDVEKAAGAKISINIDTAVKAVWEEIPVTFTISFIANGGTGTMSDITDFSGDYTLPENTFTAPEGKRFKGWDVNGTAMNVGDTITVTDDTDITAIWEDIPTHTITIVAGDGVGEKIEVTIDDTGKYTLPENSFTAPEGKRFKGWDVNGTAMNVGDTITVTDDTDITAIWEDIPKHTITIVAGDEIIEITIDDTGRFVLPQNVFKAPYGKRFKCWNVDGVEMAEGEAIIVTDDITVTAIWETDYDFYNKLYSSLVMLHNHKFTITVSSTEGGSITASGSNTVKYSKDITYSITPALGYEIKAVLVDGKDVGAVSEYTFKDVTKNHSIHAVFEAVDPYTDVRENDWFYEDVLYVSDLGLMMGTGDNKFSPDITTDRAMLVTILWRLEGSPVVDSSVEFTDVADGKWYSEAIDWASANGIVNGYGNGEFGPTDQITREQIAAILYRYAEYKKWTNDVSLQILAQYSYSKWAEKNVIWAESEGLFDDIGVDVSTLTEKASRAELAAYLHRFCKNIVK